MKLLFKIILYYLLLKYYLVVLVRQLKWHIKLTMIKKIIMTDKDTDKLQESIAKTNNEDYVFNGRMIATPIIGVLGLFTAPLILAANVSLDVKDRLVASEMSESCGGDGSIENKEIAQDVVVNGTLGFFYYKVQIFLFILEEKKYQ